MYSSTVNIREGTTPIEQGSVVINAKRANDELRRRNANPKSFKESNNECYSILPGEVCLRSVNGSYKTRGIGSSFHCFSSLNNLNFNIRNRADKDAFYKKYTLAGVATNGSAYTTDMTSNSPEFVVMIGGIKQVYNTGSDPISQGDVVAWKLPKEDAGKNEAQSNDPDFHRNKVVVELYKYESNNAEYDGIFTTKGTNNAARAIIIQSKFIVGTALSSAGPGEPFDIKIGYNSV